MLGFGIIRSYYVFILCVTFYFMYFLLLLLFADVFIKLLAQLLVHFQGDVLPVLLVYCVMVGLGVGGGVYLANTALFS